MLCDPCIVCACVCACCCSEVDPELKICSSVELGGVDAEEDEEVVDGEVEGAIGFLVEAVAAVMVVAEGGMGSQREIVRCVEKAIVLFSTAPRSSNWSLLKLAFTSDECLEYAFWLASVQGMPNSVGFATFEGHQNEGNSFVSSNKLLSVKFGCR